MITTSSDQRERIRGHLASLMNACRPDWDVAGCVAALRSLPPNLPVVEMAIAAMRLCGDPANRTPAVLTDLRNHAWDSDWYLPCREHPQTRARHTSGECAACRADRRGIPNAPMRDRGGKPIPDEARELITAALQPEATR